MLVPDHSTIAEFRRRHEAAVGELFVEVLALCAEAGLVTLGEIAVDGTKLHASASYDRNRGNTSIVEEILDEAEQTDRQEDERYGDARGDELLSSCAPAKAVARRCRPPANGCGPSAKPSRQRVSRSSNTSSSSLTRSGL
jgi:hypothetical protein